MVEYLLSTAKIKYIGQLYSTTADEVCMNSLTMRGENPRTPKSSWCEGNIWLMAFKGRENRRWRYTVVTLAASQPIWRGPGP